MQMGRKKDAPWVALANGGQIEYSEMRLTKDRVNTKPNIEMIRFVLLQFAESNFTNLVAYTGELLRGLAESHKRFVRILSANHLSGYCAL